MQADTTPYSQLTTHKLVELKLTTRQLPESQLATQKVLDLYFTDKQLALIAF